MTIWFIQFNTEITIVVFILTFILIIIYRKINAKKIDLFMIVGGTISAALAPSGVTLIFYSLTPQVNLNIEDFRLFIAVAGIVLISVAIGAISRNLEEVNEQGNL